MTLYEFYSSIFNMRQTGDYDDLIAFDGEKVSEFVEPADKLVEAIGKLLT